MTDFPRETLSVKDLQHPKPVLFRLSGIPNRGQKRPNRKSWIAFLQQTATKLVKQMTPRFHPPRNNRRSGYQYDTQQRSEAQIVKCFAYRFVSKITTIRGLVFVDATDFELRSRTRWSSSWPWEAADGGG
jgi:hypothetical protein